MSRFQKGQPSPNPAGRPIAKIAKFRKMIGELTGDGREIAEGLRTIWLDPSNPLKERLAAAELLLHYFLGKPEQNVAIAADVTARRGQALDGPRIVAQLSLQTLRELDAAQKQLPAADTVDAEFTESEEDE